jgi:hypothetical protein
VKAFPVKARFYRVEEVTTSNMLTLLQGSPIAEKYDNRKGTK